MGWGWCWSTLLLPLPVFPRMGKITLTHMYMHLHFEYLTRQLCMGKIFLINLYPKAQNLIFLLIILPSISKRVVSHNNFIRPFKKICCDFRGSFFTSNCFFQNKHFPTTIVRESVMDTNKKHFTN